MNSRNSPVYDELNKGWKSTCRILLGEEIGELNEYRGWLKGYATGMGKRKSHISGKEVAVSLDEYCDGARFVSMEEAKEKSIDPLTINEIKDIDSIIEAVSEKWEYCGNTVLGNSKFVEGSSMITNSQYICDSYGIEDSSHVAYGFFTRKNSSYIFGSSATLSEFAIRSGIMNVKRGFEAIYVTNSSDIYFAFNCNGCNDLMFCFNQRNKRNCIGNLQLQPDEYRGIKAKLIAEMADELKRNKKLPSILELCNDTKPKDVKIDVKKKAEPAFDIKPIENAFSSTFKVLFSKEIGSITQYEDYLSRHIEPLDEGTSPFGSKVYRILAPPQPTLPKNRLVSEEEADELAKISLDKEEIGNLDSLKASMDKISYFVGQFKGGSFSNYDKCYFVLDSSNVYKVSDANNTEYSGIDHMSFKSKYVFGCWKILESQFAINCHNSIRLNRCFEVDASDKCSDTYFAHNCEGLQDAMFCWNVKAKRHAIGNAQLDPGRYKTLKENLVSQMADDIINNRLKYDIFNIGCNKR